jgi:hypothetical protein
MTKRDHPTPVCKCFVLCRQLFVDAVRQDYAIVSPVHQVFSSRYPLTERLSIFARWSNAHGSYEIEVQLRSLEGEVLSAAKMNAPFTANDPLQIWIVPLHDLPITVPAPGKYEVALLASGVEVATDVLIAHQM